MNKSLVVSFAVVAAVFAGSTVSAKADNGTRVTKGVLSPTHAHVALPDSADEANCNSLSRACAGNRVLYDATSSGAMAKAPNATIITKGKVSNLPFDDGELADLEDTGGTSAEIEVIEYEIDVL